MQNHSYENDFDLRENETAYRTHLHTNGFALRLVLKQRHKRTRKWPILKQQSRGAKDHILNKSLESLNFFLFNIRKITLKSLGVLLALNALKAHLHRLHRRFLSWQLDAIFVALKLHQVSNMIETPAISRRQIALKIAPGLHVRF